jgi:hypothetical protein
MAETNSQKPLKLTNVVDPRLDCLDFVQKDNMWGVFKGCEGSNSVAQQANSYSTSGITFNFNTQSENVIVDRRMYCRAQFQMTFVGTAPLGQPLLNTESDALRCLPLASVTQSLKVTINGSSVESQYSDALQAIMRYNLPEEMKNLDLSMSPCAQDKYQRYQDGVGSVRNSLSSYQNSGAEIGRGAFELDFITNPLSPDAAVTPITAVVRFTVTEPLLISPMCYSSQKLEAGLIGVKNVGVQFNFSAGQLTRVWSRSPVAGVTITSATCAIGAGTTTPPSLLVNYLTPPLISQSQIPRSVNYQYYKSEVFVNDMNSTLASNATQRFTNNAIQLSAVPRCIYIYASMPNSDKTYMTTDTFHALSNLSLNYLNVSGQFSSMTIQDLYQMCVKNGCNLSWLEWSGRTRSIGEAQGGISGTDGMTGSVIKLDVSDLHIPSNVASGMNVNSQLSFSVDVTNINQAGTVLGVQLVTTIVYDGLMTIQNGSMATQVGIISQSDVTSVRADRSNYMDFNSAASMIGGSMFGKLGHFASKASKVLDAVCGAKAAMGGKEHHGGELVNSKHAGGRAMSRSELKKRLFD